MGFPFGGLWPLFMTLAYYWNTSFFIKQCMNDLILQTANRHFDCLDCMIITSRINGSVRVLNHAHVMCPWSPMYYLTWHHFQSWYSHGVNAYHRLGFFFYFFLWFFLWFFVFTFFFNYQKAVYGKYSCVLFVLFHVHSASNWLTVQPRGQLNTLNCL